MSDLQVGKNRVFQDASAQTTAQNPALRSPSSAAESADARAPELPWHEESAFDSSSGWEQPGLFELPPAASGPVQAAPRGLPPLTEEEGNDIAFQIHRAGAKSGVALENATTTLTELEDGRIAVTSSGSLSPAQREAAARLLEGRDLVFVEGRNNPADASEPNPFYRRPAARNLPPSQGVDHGECRHPDEAPCNHGEARGIAAGLDPEIASRAARQWSYSDAAHQGRACPPCEGEQAAHGVTNMTGTQSAGGMQDPLPGLRMRNLLGRGPGNAASVEAGDPQKMALAAEPAPASGSQGSRSLAAEDGTSVAKRPLASRPAPAEEPAGTASSASPGTRSARSRSPRAETRSDGASQAAAERGAQAQRGQGSRVNVTGSLYQDGFDTGNPGASDSFVGPRAGTRGSQSLSVSAEGVTAEYSREAYAGLYAEKSGGVEGEYGSASYAAQAKAEARAGVDASATVDSNGLDARAAAGVSVGVEASVRGSAQTRSVEVAGVEVNAGVDGGAKVEATASAEAGAGVQVTRNPPTAIVEGSAGASAVAKAEADVTASAGPFSITASGYASAGAEAKADGAVGFEDGKLVLRGGLGAAVGLGLGGDVGVEVDVAQIGQMAVNTVEDLPGAKQVASAVEGGADAVADGAKEVASTVKDGADAIADGAKSVASNAAHTVMGWFS